MSLDRACAALAGSPVDADAFLAAVRPYLWRMAQRFFDPDEVAQRALIRVQRAMSRCRARSPGRLRAWLRTIVQRVGYDLVAAHRGEPLDHDVVDWVPGEDPALQEALERCLHRAVGLDPAGLPPAERAIARRMRVPRRADVRERYVACLVRTRIDGLPAAAVADELGVTEGMVRTGATRGAALVALTARVLLHDEADPFVAGALHTIASRGSVGPEETWTTRSTRPYGPGSRPTTR